MTLPPTANTADILVSLSNPALVVGRQGRVLRANPAAGVFWGLPRLRLEDFSLEQLFGRDSPVSGWVKRVIDEDSPVSVEDYRFEGENNASTTLLRIQIDPLFTPGESVGSALVLLWDQSRLQLLEAENRENRVMEAISVMVRRLAHELRNPMSGMKGATQLLQRRLKDQEELAEYSGVILKELERLERLAGSMLFYGDNPPLNRCLFNLHELLDEVIWFERNAGAQVEFNRLYDPSLPDMLADRDRIHQVLLNLIRNAVEASPPGSSITVRTSIFGPWQRPHSESSSAKISFRVDVEDSGPGVPEQLRGRLFTPFFTTKTEGTGLGLSICQQIARAHQGVLRYFPQPGGGSCFFLLIPMVEQE
ncbi:MAG: ATP-binding protein [Deltaproteobacteria bacterium]|nr:ATP-binding protein [Deltaproteobacteria bacterium]